MTFSTFHVRARDLLTKQLALCRRDRTDGGFCAGAAVLAGHLLTGVHQAGLQDMLLAVAAGGVSYSAVLLGLWQIVGRPSGAETYVLDQLRRSWIQFGRARLTTRAN